MIAHSTKMVALEISRGKQEGCDSTMVALEISRRKQEGCDSIACTVEPSSVILALYCMYMFEISK